MRTSMRFRVSVALAGSLFTALAQQTGGYLTNVITRGGNIQFDVVSSTPTNNWMIEAADQLSGEWAVITSSQPQSQNSVVVPVDRPIRYFRARWGPGIYSTNVAGYFRRSIPSGYSMIAHHFDQGRNTLAEVLPNPPEGSTLYKYDNVQQVWSSVSYFRFGAWDQPGTSLARCEGSFFHNPGEPFELIGAGTVSGRKPFLTIRMGWNLLSKPEPGVYFPSGYEFEYDYVFWWESDFFIPQYHLAEFYFGAWDAHWEFRIEPGESFWYCRKANYDGSPSTSAVAVLLANEIKGFVESPIPNAACRRQGSNWLGQLYSTASLDSPPGPVGDPLPFLTGVRAGYLDTRPGSLRYVPPELSTKSNLFLQVRYWDKTFGSTFEAAEAAGGPVGRTELRQYAVPERQVGDLSRPPNLPITLDLNPSPSDAFNISRPADVRVAAGARAQFAATVVGATNLTYQWQRRAGLNECGNPNPWLDLPGAVAPTLVIDPVSVESAGLYHVSVGEVPSGRQRTSPPGALYVLRSAKLTGPEIDRAASQLHLQLRAEEWFALELEVSNTLSNWNTLQRVYVTGESMPIAIPWSPAAGAQFYRARYSSWNP